MSAQRAVLLLIVLSAGRCLAQDQSEEGILWGSFRILPSVYGAAAHDSRALQCRILKAEPPEAAQGREAPRGVGAPTGALSLADGR